MATVTITRFRDEEMPEWEFFTFSDGIHDLTTGDGEQAGVWSFEGGSVLASELLQLRAFLNHPAVVTLLRRDAAAERVCRPKTRKKVQA